MRLDYQKHRIFKHILLSSVAALAAASFFTRALLVENVPAFLLKRARRTRLLGGEQRA